MGTWLQNRLKAAEEMLEAVDRRAKTVAVPRRDAHGQSKGSAPTSDSVTPQALHGGNPASTADMEEVPLDSNAAGPTGPTGLANMSAVPAAPMPGAPANSLHLVRLEDSGDAAEDPPGRAGAPDQPEDTIPCAPRLLPAQIPFESSPSATMLQMPCPMPRDEPLRPATPPADAPPRDDAPQERASGARHAEESTADSSQQASKIGAGPASGSAAAEPLHVTGSAAGSEHERMLAPTSLEGGSSAAAAAVAAAISAAAAAAEQAESAAASGEGVEHAHDMASREREARLARVVEQLKRRLDQLREENDQLEDMLRQADRRFTDLSARVGQLEDALAEAEAGREVAHASLASVQALTQQELRELSAQRDAALSQMAEMQAKAATLEQENASLLANRQASQEDMLAALRGEVAAAERRLQEERDAHASARRTFVAREAELEANLSDSGAALAAMQRSLADKGARCAAAEERAADLQRDGDSLAQQLAAVQAQHAGREAQESDLQPTAAGNAAAEIAALQKAHSEQRAALQAATDQLRAAQEHNATLQEEVDRLSSEVRESGPASDLQRQFREVTELLYQKQTQLEHLAAEKAAQQLTLEREIEVTRQQADRVSRRARSDRASGSHAPDGDVVVPMEAMGEAYRRLADNNRVGGAVKAGAMMLDATASSVVRILKQYPLGRLGVFLYAIFIHVFIWVLINRLQHRALYGDHMAAGNHTLPSLADQM